MSLMKQIDEWLEEIAKMALSHQSKGYSKVIGRVVSNMNVMECNGIKVTVEGDEIKIKMPKGSKSEEIKIDTSKDIKGDVMGNIVVTGNNVTIKIEGDMTGNIEGATTVEVDGDFTGCRR